MFKNGHSTRLKYAIQCAMITTFLALYSDPSNAAEIPFTNFSSFECHTLEARALPSIEARIRPDDIIRVDRNDSFHIHQIDWKKEIARKSNQQASIKLIKHENGRQAVQVHSVIMAGNMPLGTSTLVIYQNPNVAVPGTFSLMNSQVSHYGLSLGVSPAVHVAWGYCVGRK